MGTELTLNSIPLDLKANTPDFSFFCHYKEASDKRTRRKTHTTGNYHLSFATFVCFFVPPLTSAINQLKSLVNCYLLYILCLSSEK